MVTAVLGRGKHPQGPKVVIGRYSITQCQLPGAGEAGPPGHRCAGGGHAGDRADGARARGGPLRCQGLPRTHAGRHSPVCRDLLSPTTLSSHGAESASCHQTFSILFKVCFALMLAAAFLPPSPRVAGFSVGTVAMIGMHCRTIFDANLAAQLCLYGLGALCFLRRALHPLISVNCVVYIPIIRHSSLFHVHLFFWYPTTHESVLSFHIHNSCSGCSSWHLMCPCVRQPSAAA